MSEQSRSSRSAGVVVPLFSLHSSASWGVGEIGDIPAMASWLGSAHQNILQFLPLTEMAPDQPSPYSPLSAMAIDPQFISLRLLDDFVAEGGEGALDADRARALAAVRARRTIDYPEVRTLKRRALTDAFERFCEVEWAHDTPRARALKAFMAAEQWWLDAYSLYRALRAECGERPWMDWDEPLRRRDPAALAGARGDLARDILFRQYLQWVADGQWRAARHAAGPVALFGDFGFMVAADSADVWARQDEFMLDATIGTPPDAFSETGQDWGLPPCRWEEMAKRDYEWLRQRARRNATLYAGYRVDHLVGFYRTYVRPLSGQKAFFLPADSVDQVALGERLLALLTSAGSRLTVEDLGIIPPYVGESVRRMGLPGYRVLRWERDWEREERPFLDPATYPITSVAASGTHDTEPLAAWWESAAPEDRRALGEIPSVRSASGGAVDWSADRLTAAVRDAVLEALYASPSDFVILPIQDIFGWRERINQPATTGEQNWTYLVPWPVDRWASEPEAIACAHALRRWSDRYDRWKPDEP